MVVAQFSISLAIYSVVSPLSPFSSSYCKILPRQYHQYLAFPCLHLEGQGL